MAIYHGSVARPVALQRSESPVGRPLPSHKSPTELLEQQNPGLTAAVGMPSEALVVDRGPADDGLKKKRSKSAKSKRTVDAGVPASAVADVVPAVPASPLVTPVAMPASLSDSVEQLLHLPRGELARLLAEADGSANKVWLALIYRLSALESQVSELAAALRSAAAPAAKMPVAASRTGGGDGRPDVLEQVFRKNLSLRKGGGD